MSLPKILFIILAVFPSLQLVGQDDRHPIRFGLQYLAVPAEVEEDDKQQLTNSIESAIKEVVDQCDRYLSIVSGDAKKAMLFYINQGDTTNLSLPQGANFVVIPRLQFVTSYSQFTLRISIYRKKGQSSEIEELDFGKSESNLPESDFFTSDNLNKIAEEAVRDVLTSQNLENWIEEEIGSSFDYSSCFSPLRKAPLELEEDLPKDMQETVPAEDSASLPPLYHSLTPTLVVTGISVTTFIQSRTQYSYYEQAYRGNETDIADALYSSAKNLEKWGYFSAGVALLSAGAAILIHRKRKRK